MKRNVNDVSEVELNCMGVQRIGESIEGLLRCGFKIFDNGNYFFNSRLVDHTTRSIDEQTNVLVKLNFRWQLHFVLPFPSELNPHFPFSLKESEFQARGKVEAVAFDAVTDVEVVDPARVEIEVALTQLGGIGNDGANAESASPKTVEPGRH